MRPRNDLEAPQLPFRKVLIANRGEIAVRIARTCAELGITSVAVYSEVDLDSLHVRSCDEAYLIGGASAAESYLRADAIIEAARKSGSDAIHPGFGFLSENASFARAVTEAGLAWVGPSPEAIALMGSKIDAKRLAQQAGVPVVPGYFGSDKSPARLSAEARTIGFPLLVKASASGGGKGMRIVTSEEELLPAIDAAKREALAAFGDDSVMLERYLTEPRHIEVQILGDAYGNVVHLGERECSIQRRYQKVLEESPSPIVTPALRDRLTSAAVKLAKESRYSNAGTVEFIYQDGEFFFLEMNTRLQVEHTVTEEALDFDLVEAQLRIAAGERLWFEQDDMEFIGHAIEVRLYAEDPARNFLPSTGRISRLESPHEEGNVRIDAGVAAGDLITPYYDPMIAKIITSGASRNEAIRRMREVLGGMVVEGVTTNLDFLRWLVGHPQFELGNLSTGFIDRYYRPGAFPIVPAPVLVAGAAVRLLSSFDQYAGDQDVWASEPWRLARQGMTLSQQVEGHGYTVALSNVAGQSTMWRAKVEQGENLLLDDQVYLGLAPANAETDSFDDSPPTVRVQLGGDTLHSIEYGWQSPEEIFVVWDRREYLLRTTPALSTEHMDKSIHLRGDNSLESPMPGKVLKLLGHVGENVVTDQPLVIVEAMKMEFTVRAPHDGRIASVNYAEGEQVAVGDVLLELERE